ncbi:unnamed protein product [Malus baccata var. baccata]
MSIMKDMDNDHDIFMEDINSGRNDQISGSKRKREPSRRLKYHFVFNFEEVDHLVANPDSRNYKEAMDSFEYEQWQQAMNEEDELIGVVRLDIRANFWSDVGVLVRDKCGVDWESWKVIPEELKMHLIDEYALSYYNPNLMKAIDNIFKSRFREWKFDNQRAAEVHREP